MKDAEQAKLSEIDRDLEISKIDETIERDLRLVGSTAIEDKL